MRHRSRLAFVVAALLTLSAHSGIRAASATTVDIGQRTGDSRSSTFLGRVDQDSIRVGTVGSVVGDGKDVDGAANIEATSKLALQQAPKPRFRLGVAPILILSAAFFGVLVELLGRHFLRPIRYSRRRR